MKKSVVLFLALAMSLTALTGCGTQTTTEEPSAAPSEQAVSASPAGDSSSDASMDELWAKLDTSKAATVNMYVVATEPVAMQEIEDLVNVKLNEKINTTLDISFVTLSEYETKYPLLLAGGDDVDLVYTSNWCYYKQEVDKGAYLELSEDFLKTNMPVTYRDIAPIAWEQIKVNGKIYAVPRNDASLFATGGVIVRKDMQAKYNIPEINTLDDYEKYLLAVAKNESASGMFAFYGSSYSVLRSLFLPQKENWQYIGSSSHDIYWDADEPASADSVFLIFQRPEYLSYCKKMAEFAKAGIWPSNAITTNTYVKDWFREGKSASTYANYYDDDSLLKQSREKGVEAEYYNVFPENYLAKQDAYAGDAMAITAFSTQPERAALCLDVIKNDLEINRLLACGVEGKHYIYNAQDNTYTTGPSAADYPLDYWTWGIRSVLLPKPGGREECMVKAAEEINAAKMPDEQWPFNGFYFDTAKVSSEDAVISSLVTEYAASFDLGVFGDDTEAKYNEFMTKLKEAGLDKFMAEYVSQALAKR